MNQNNNQSGNDKAAVGFRLSPQQQRLWELCQVSRAYSLRFAVEVEGKLDHAKLSQAVSQVAEAQTILKANFARQPGSIVPIQTQGSGITWEEDVDLSTLDAKEREEHVESFWKKIANSEKIEEGNTALRLCLVRLGETKHQLLVSLNPMCGDAFTVDLFLEAVAANYGSNTGPVPYEGLQYVQFAEWQNGLVETADNDLAEASAYWSSRPLVPADLSWPTRYAPTSGEFDVNSVRLMIPSDLIGAVSDAATQMGLTKSDFLFASWSAFVWRWMRSVGAPIGFVSNGRRYDELREVMGLIARCLPVSLDVDGDSSFESLAVALTGRLNEAMEWQDYFLYLPITGANGGPPESLDVAFEYEERAEPVKSGGIAWSVCRRQAVLEPHLVKLGCICEGDLLIAELSYDTSRYDSELAGQLLNGWLTLLKSAACNPQRAVNKLSLLDHEEQAEIFHRLTGPDHLYPDTKCFHELFAEQAARTPDAVAVRLGDKTLTYGQLNEQANQLAEHLRDQGMGPEKRAVLCLSRSPELVVAIMGVLKAGGAYIPLDSTYPTERLAQILEEASPIVVLTHSSLSDRFSASDCPVVSLDRNEWPEPTGGHRDKLAACPDNLVYVIYTSGSTGRPKGVMITHRALVNYLSWCTSFYGVATSGGTIVDTPIGFDLTVTSLLSPLIVGQTAELVPEESGLDGLSDALQRANEITLVKTTPAYLDVLRNILPENAPCPARVFVIGGEALRWDSVSYWRSRAPKTRMVNEYGPTETVVGCCIFEADSTMSYGYSVPIGRPIANMSLYLLDELLQPVPAGMPGELYISGVGVGRGYLSAPELTAEKFVPDPFGQKPGARMYRSGDLCRLLPDGNLEYLGRTDRQVKLRGFRIELDEIENVLLKHDGIREAAVVVREDTPDEKRLVAYFVAANGSLDIASLTEHAKVFLPEYMLPSRMMALNALPLTSNGKVDRKALPAPEASEASILEYVAPRSEVEEKLVEIWSELLRISPISVHDNFFELGGHSVLATQVGARVRKTFNVDLPLRSLFEAPTIAGLSEQIEAGQTEDPDVAHLLAELEQLTDDEAKDRLADVSGT